MTAATPAPGMLDELPGEFTFEFTSSIAYCSQGIDVALDHIADPARRAEFTTATAGMDDDDAHYHLSAAADALDDAVTCGQSEHSRRDATLAMQLRDAAGDLTWHDYACDCSAEARECSTSALDELLSSFGNQVWGLHVTHAPGMRHELIEPAEDIDGDLTLDALWDRVGHRAGWEEFTATWDGRALAVRFNGASCGPVRVEAVPLDAEQHLLWQRWCQADPYETGVAYELTIADLADVQTALDLWDEIEDTASACWNFGDLYAALTRVGDITVTEELVLAITALAFDWCASLDDLLTTAATVAAPAPAPIAATAASAA